MSIGALRYVTLMFKQRSTWELSAQDVMEGVQLQRIELDMNTGEQSRRPRAEHFTLRGWEDEGSSKAVR